MSQTALSAQQAYNKSTRTGFLRNFHDPSGRPSDDASTRPRPTPSAMAQDQRPPLPSLSSQSSATDLTLTDPFTDRQRAINFAEPTFPTPNQSVASFPNEFGNLGDYDEDEEKRPLTREPGTSYP